MLLEIYTNHDIITVAEISDCNYDAVSKAFEMIGHPEYTLDPKDQKTIEQDKEIDLYDWDDIATAMVEQGKKDMSDVDYESVESIGTIKVLTDKYTVIEQC